MAAPIALDSVRVPCPLCRKPIHPIAGRCRHCQGHVVGKVVAAAPPPPPRRVRASLVAALLVTIVAAIGTQLLVA